MSFWTPDSLCAAAGGEWIAKPGAGASSGGGGEIAGVSIDSRTIKPGEAYIALRGERFDGHAFVQDAVRNGAAMVFVEDASAASPETRGSAGAVLVADTRAALLRLGKACRRSCQGVRVVAVTGSNGKTTTVRFIDAVLGARYKGVASVKSFNNDIGVPLTLLRVRADDEYVICEVGMNAPGEIAPLADAIEPDAAVITNIGRAHLEALGSVEGIAREKGTLLRFLRPGGVAVVPAGERLLEESLRGAPGVVTFGEGQGADLRAGDVEHVPLTTGPRAGETGLRFTINGNATYEIPVIGAHNAGNAAAALAVARHFGVSEAQARAGLAGAQPAEMRLARRAVAGMDVFNDAYNANPDSAIAAVRTFVDLARGASRRVIVLGEMREQGSHASEGHRAVAEAMLAASTPGAPIDLVIVVGEHAKPTAERLLREWPPARVAFVPDASPGEQGGAARIAALLQPGDSVLLKGSRSVGLERVEQALTARGAGRERSSSLAAPR